MIICIIFNIDNSKHVCFKNRFKFNLLKMTPELMNLNNIWVMSITFESLIT